MSLFVYITEECQKDAKKYAYQKQINKFAERLRREQRTTLFDNFPPPFLKKRFERQIRLIAAERFFDEHVIVVFYRILTRGGRDYDQQFLADPTKYGKEHFFPLAPDNDLRLWLQKQLQESPPPPLPRPDEVESSYLWSVLDNSGAGKSDGGRICESPHWVEQVQDKSLKERLVLLCEPILDLFLRMEGTPTEGMEELSIRSDLKVAYRYFASSNVLYLISPMTGDLEKCRQEAKKVCANVLDLPPDASTEHIFQCSARAYPAEVLCEEQLWLDAEKDEVANLALSPEEASVLSSSHFVSSKCAGSGFPLFINGRAGSGKSTVLQYLFADYLHNYLSKGANGPSPLYFAYSRELVERARQSVLGLLQCGYRYREKRGDHHEHFDLQSTTAMNCFRDFHGFLYSQLTPDEREGQFSRENYVSYSRFRSLWNDKFSHERKALKLYPPDVCWHVLRTYVKGISLDDYLEPDEYTEQPKDERTVSAQTYKNIFEIVWQKWYANLIAAELLWDDQDLIRFLLDAERLRPEYATVFADEAQDFTRIELEALLRLSVFSARRLEPTEVNRVPFAFAGDPFQTLNPTGFRWSSIKSAFVVKFIHALDPARQSQAKDLNYHELSKNYRSSKNIVRFCNTLQLVRSILFGAKDIQPQDTWRSDRNAAMPVYFDRGNPEVIDALKNNPDVTIILPCGEGEEIDSVNNDDFLKAVVDRSEAGVPRNVLSAVRAKGQEFQRVVLYGFGADDCVNELAEPIAGFQPLADDPEKALPLEYFFNRVYVGASRAKKRLFIIDSPEGLRRLWGFATASFPKLAASLERDSVWKDRIGELLPGVRESWSDDQEDLGRVAEQYERIGKLNHDPYYLDSAAQNYGRAGQDLKATQCTALAHIYRDEFELAGNAYIKIGSFNHALDAYWRGRNFKSLLDLATSQPQFAQRMEVQISEYFARTPTIPRAMKLLADVFARSESDGSGQAILSEPGMRASIQDVIDSVCARIPSDGLDTEWRSILNDVQRLQDRGVAVSADHLGRLHYQIDDFQKALELWEEAESTAHALYKKAKTRHVIRQLQAGVPLSLSSDEHRSVADFYKESKNFDGALSHYRAGGDTAGIRSLYSLIPKDERQPLGHRFAAAFLESSVSNAEWAPVIDFCTNEASAKALSDFLPSGGGNGTPWILRAAVIRAFSHSELLVRADNRKVKMPASDFLKRVLITEGYAWLDNLHVSVAGAAIERAGRIVDCLQFYENVQSNSSISADDIRLAASRWVKCKQRQAGHEKEHGKAKSAEKLKAEVEKRAKELSLDIHVLDEFPKPILDAPTKRRTVATGPIPPSINKSELPMAPPPQPIGLAGQSTTAGTPQVTGNVGDFRFEYDRSSGKLNVTKGLDTLALRLQKESCTSADVDVSKDGLRFIAAAWQLEIDLGSLEADHCFNVRLIDLGLTLRFDAN